MLYLEEEFEGRDMTTHLELSHVEQVSHPCEDNWKISKINHERMPYFEVESTFKGKEDMEEGHSPRDEYDDEDVEIFYS